MARALKISEIIKDGQNIISSSSVFSSVRFICASNSSCKVDNVIFAVLDHYLALFVLIAYSHYQNKSNECLSSDSEEELKEIFKSKAKIWKNEEVSESFKRAGAAFLKKFYRLEESKHEYKKHNFVIFDDTSSEHDKAFKNHKEINFPKKNILLKLIYKDTHLRLGISLEEKNTIEIINIDHKKNMKK